MREKEKKNNEIILNFNKPTMAAISRYVLTVALRILNFAQNIWYNSDLQIKEKGEAPTLGRRGNMSENFKWEKIHRHFELGKMT